MAPSARAAAAFVVAVPSLPRARGASAARRGVCAVASHVFFATCARGLGRLLADELQAAPIHAHVTDCHPSGVFFETRAPERQPFVCGVRACVHSRLSTRVLHLLDSQLVHQRIHYQLIYQFVHDALRTRVSELFADGRLSFRVQARVAAGVAVNEKLAATAARDALLDLLRAAHAPRAARPLAYAHADVPLFVALAPHQLSLYRDMSGAPLHKRSFRQHATHVAALNECVAAAMLTLAGFHTDSTHVLVDPMCGGATILTEAAMIRLRIPAAWFRAERFAFCRWLDVDAKQLLRRERAMAAQLIRDARAMPPQLFGYDKHARAAKLGADNVRAGDMQRLVEVRQGDAEHVHVPHAPQLVVCNPPWGTRLSGEQHAWHALGHFLRRNAGDGNTAVLLCGKKGASDALRLKARAKVPVRVGNVDARVLLYDVHARR